MNAINWFEIPVRDMPRAIAFYSAVLDKQITPMKMGDVDYAFLPSGEGGVGGGLTAEPQCEPAGAKGVVIYLNGGDDLSVPLGRVATAGGSVTQEKMSIGENGHIGFFMDTEGNHVGLHSMG
ncbi:MAG: VOC family protein [Ardenticatenales bacterium]|nr:VOC family protein [Ardenticatenales bacterium]